MRNRILVRPDYFPSFPPEELDLRRLGHELPHHERKEGRLRPLRVVHAAAVRHQAVRRHHQEEVLDDAADGGRLERREKC